MLATVFECTLGFLLACITLRDVFDTVVVSGPAGGTLRVPRRLVAVFLPVWKRVAHRPIGVEFAPLVLVASFAVWMLLLVLAFGLMAHALRDSFSPRLPGFGQALYLAGSALATVGTAGLEGNGLAAVVVVGAGLCGLAVMTMAVTYLIEVQTNIGSRDRGVLKITTTAGQPPTGVAVLERYAALGSRDELTEVLRHGRDWSASVLQSHESHPPLIYFRSAGTAAGWPATVGALIDLSLVIELLLDEPQWRGAAVLLREQCERLVEDLATLLHLEPAPAEATPADVDVVRERLRVAGYRLRADADPAAFLAARQQQAACVQALSRHLGTPGAPLLPPPQAIEKLRASRPPARGEQG
ncbi:hypothetical protein JJB11_25450 [Ramlibacter ginsenosidimutans]|uniref:Two pore domain potassium channel family protein n=1 Tax=Ramlibacter ginsenosidimutans TaxID=502333 RepID=A0A934TYE5_9BURK|nr:hypothetical protein [Ramlibacter ginsenosidimutans]MBK6009458.1 hypothetical protein [Ramlibacter ginsenosidimutans]